MVFGLFAAWVGWEMVSFHFRKRVAEFDLAQLEKMEAASIIYDREGKELGKIFIQNRHPVKLAQISPRMVEAVVAAEDNKFYEHGGVDYAGILRAALANYRRGKISQGASTVTQQLARNSFELRERTYQRKLVEMFLSQRIEENLSKEKIMELYLNRVYFGSGFYGVEAAARGYFGRSAKELSIGQCAALAGLLKSPQALSPWNNLEAATSARNFVLKRMRDQGFITRDELTQETELKLIPVKRTNPFKVSYAIDFIRQQAIAALGYERAMNGGFRIYTTLDSKMQRMAEVSLREALSATEKREGYNHETFEKYRDRVKDIEAELNRGNMSVKLPEPKYLQGAVLAIDNASGGILTMVGGRDFKHSEYNRAVQGRRAAGTVFTPFVFAAAYENGAFPGETVEDSCIDNRFVMVGGDSGILGEWGVERVNNEYEGPIPSREALFKGKNAATVRLGLRTGLDAVKKVTADAGIQSPLRNFANSYLGSSEATLDELTLAYTIFPGGGLRPKQTYIIEKITDNAGSRIFTAQAGKIKVISPEAAYQVHAGLEDVLRKGTASGAFPEQALQSFPVAGKTGTAYNFTDAYFIGYDSSVTCGVWVGFDKPTKIFRGAFGRDLALPIWTQVMNASVEKFPAVKFLKPDTLKDVEICRVSGLLATPKCFIQQINNANGQEETIPCVYKEFATSKQAPEIRCDIHGGGIRNYAKEYNQEDWPRAVAAIDLAMIRPIAVSAPPLLGLNDVYNAVKPAAQKLGEDDIPVARALPVNGEDPSNPAAVPGTPTTLETTPAASVEPEVRKAEAVTPLDSPLDAPSIQAPTPEPINF